MTIERDPRNSDASFTGKLREQSLVWIKFVGSALKPLFARLRGMGAGIKTSTWLIFAIVLAGNIIAFNYYQQRITRYYLSVLLLNIVRMNEDIDILQGKINQLHKKADDIGAKLDKPVSQSSSVVSASPSSNLTKPRSR